MRDTEFEVMRQEARDHILEMLEEYEGYTCDFHNEAFNMEFYEEDEEKAENKLEEMGVYNCLWFVTEYERNEFGEICTDISNPVKLLSMVWYIIGEQELYSMFDGCELWDEFDDEIGEEETKKLIAWYKEQEA